MAILTETVFQMNFFKNIFNKTKPGNQTIDLPLMSSVQEPTEVQKPKPIIEEISIEKPVLLMTKERENELIQLLAEESLNTNNNDFRIENDFDLGDKDPLFEDAARLIVASQIGSTSLLQRRMKLGYNQAGRIMDQLEAAGIVGENQGSKARDVLIKTESELQNYFEYGILSYSSGADQINMRSFYEEHRNEIEAKKEELLQQLEDEKLRNEKEQIRQELLEKERKRKLQREVLKELIDEGAIFNAVTDKDGKRESIPQDVMDKVWNRDGGKCVICGSQENLEFDHIIPFSKGGATTYRNLQILCKKCNIEKSNNIG